MSRGNFKKMKKIFTIGEAAGKAGTTAETLRHYDRIGLVKPSQKDEWTNYRYYTEKDIVLITTIRTLQQMDVPLKRIKEVLEYDDIGKIIDFLEEAEKHADEKIALLKKSKAVIHRAKADFEGKAQRVFSNEICVERFPERTILLSNSLEEPSVENLWNYLSHFYKMIGKERKEQFEFENTAGIYTENGRSRLFAVCAEYVEIDGLITLPAGDYLCVDCSDNERTDKLTELLNIAEKEYKARPNFTVQQIIVSGILQWKYQLRVLVRKKS